MVATTLLVWMLRRLQVWERRALRGNWPVGVLVRFCQGFCQVAELSAKGSEVLPGTLAAGLGQKSPARKQSACQNGSPWCTCDL